MTPQIKVPDEIRITSGKTTNTLYLWDCSTPEETLAYVKLATMATLPTEEIIT